MNQYYEANSIRRSKPVLLITLIVKKDITIRKKKTNTSLLLPLPLCMMVQVGIGNSLYVGE